MSILMDKQDLSKVIARLCHCVCEKISTENLVMIGIRTGGAVLASRMADFFKSKGIDVPVGVLDVNPFRDDKVCGGDYVNRSQIDFSIADKDLLLVDDVLYTGRTVRAALNAINALGRPRTVSLTVLIDRGHRELPIKPDFVGKNIPTDTNQKVKVRFKEIHGYDAVEVQQS